MHGRCCLLHSTTLYVEYQIFDYHDKSVADQTKGPGLLWSLVVDSEGTVIIF